MEIDDPTTPGKTGEDDLEFQQANGGQREGADGHSRGRIWNR